jgi:hypothetical protein
MARARTIVQRTAIRTGDVARSVIVAGCALALIAAGQALPF